MAYQLTKTIKYFSERSASSLSIPSNNALLARSSSVTVNQIDNLLLDDNWSQKTVSPRQVADLVMSDGDLVIEGEKFAHIHIIDARYDYEFNGGHIKGNYFFLKTSANNFEFTKKYPKSYPFWRNKDFDMRSHSVSS